MIKLVAFDCDGVLFDSRQANIAFYNAILARFEQPVMDLAAEDYVHCNTFAKSLEYIFRGYPNLDAVLSYCSRNLDYSPFIPLMVEEPHLREFLGFLRPAFFIALATNRTTTTAAVLSFHGLTDRFDMVVSAKDVARPKPDPEAFIRILGHFGLTPREAVYIGDSEVDEAFAANAGVPLIAYRNPQLQAAYYLDSFAAGPDLIRQLNGSAKL